MAQRQNDMVRHFGTATKFHSKKNFIPFPILFKVFR